MAGFYTAGNQLVTWQVRMGTGEAVTNNAVLGLNLRANHTQFETVWVLSAICPPVTGTCKIKGVTDLIFMTRLQSA